MNIVRSRIIGPTSLAMLILSVQGLAFAATSKCPPFPAEGYDYRYVRGNLLEMVESAHFQPQVESLIRGITSTPGGDIAYVLKMYPNHPRALLAMARWAERHKTAKPPGANFTIECYFEKAIQFRSNDHIVRMLYAQFLARSNQREEALRQLDFVRNSVDDNPMTYYNAGLIYMELNDFDKALALAHKARSMGLQRMELEQQLRDKGQWREAVAAAPDASLAADKKASAPDKP